MTTSLPAIRLILEALDEPAMVVRAGSLVAANRHARTLLGAMTEGQDIRLSIRHPQALDAIMGGGDGEADLVGIGGIDRPWRVVIRRLDDGGALVRLIDSSALRSAERMRTDFVANASHELRTPLSTIIGYSETLAEDGAIDEATRQRFGSTIQIEAQRMRRIIEDLMSLSRIEADRYRAPAKLVDLGEVTRTAVGNTARLCEQRKCRIVTQIEPDLPPLRGDFGQLLQLIENLLANAVRYGAARDGQPVEVAVRRQRGRAILSVRDHGEGVDPVHLPRLTERFYRVDNARSRESGGTGLGLSIVKHIVERHRGSLDIASRPGAGTTVEVGLPLADIV